MLDEIVGLDLQGLRQPFACWRVITEEGQISLKGGDTFSYSPKCVEQKFSEVHIQYLVYLCPHRGLRVDETRLRGDMQQAVTCIILRRDE